MGPLRARYNGPATGLCPNGAVRARYGAVRARQLLPVYRGGPHLRYVFCGRRGLF